MYSRDEMEALAVDLDKAKGSALLPKVYLGTRNAEDQCLKAAAMIRQLLETEDRLRSQIDQLEQDLSDMRDNADSAYRRGYWAGSNGQ